MNATLPAGVFIALILLACACEASQLEGRMHPYPHPNGVQLGQGWSSVNDAPTQGVCVEFATQLLPYQDKRTVVSEIMDREFLKAALGFDMAGNAYGSFGVFSGKAEASTSIKGNYKSDVRTTVFVASASVTNGQQYASPTSVTELTGSGMNLTNAVQTAVAIKPGPRDEIKKKDDSFLRRCGDAFVSAIVSGGQLGAIYRMEAKSYEQKIKIRNTVSASGSFGGLFGGGASATLESELEKLRAHDGLNISYIETGGSSGDLPVDKESLKTTYQGFAKRVSESPKPIYVVLSSYDSLPSWPISEAPFSPVTTRQEMQRFQARLELLHSSIDDMKRDSQRDLTADPAYLYLFRSSLGISSDHLNVTQDVVLDAWKDVSERLRKYGADGSCKSSFRSTPNCQYSVPTDDFAFATLLPLPRNAVPSDVILILEDVNAPVADKKTLYARYLYRFYVDEPARLRCRFSGECRSNEELSKYKKWISSSLSSQGLPIEALARKAFSCIFPKNSGSPLRQLSPETSINGACAADTKARDSSIEKQSIENSVSSVKPTNAEIPVVDETFFGSETSSLSPATKAVIAKYGLMEDM